MGRSEKGGSGKKADALLGRFPVTDLAKAVAVTGEARRRFLVGFVKGFPQGTYAPVRKAVPRIYGAQLPLMPVPLETWDRIADSLASNCPSDSLPENLLVGQLLYQHAREEGYEATHTDAQVFRYGRGTAPIGLECYLTKGERLIFQFPHFRREELDMREATVLSSIVHHAYAVGDFDIGEVEIVQFLPTSRGMGAARTRTTQLIAVPKPELLDRARLSTDIDDVYGILRFLAENPP